MFELKNSLDVSNTNQTQLIEGLTSSDLLIEILGNSTFRGGDLIQPSFKNGNQFGVTWQQDGKTGSKTWIPYGESEILLDVPNPLQPFTLAIYPSRLQFNYSVRIYTRVYNPVYDSLSESLGIDQSLITRLPQQTLLLLQGIDLMKGADTREFLAKIEAANALANAAQSSASDANQAALAADAKATAAQTSVTVVEGELVSTKQEMVHQSEFELASSAFELGSNEYGPCMIATVTHALLGGSVQMSLTDKSGDEQGFSQLIGNIDGQPDKAKVELTMTQHAEADFPLTFLLQGKKSTSTVVSGIKSAVSTFFNYFLENGVLTAQSRDTGITKIVEENPAALVQEAGLLNGAVYTLDAMGNYWYYQENDHIKMASNLGNWEVVLANGVKLA